MHEELSFVYTTIETSKQLLIELMNVKKNNFHFYVTGDELWFSYEYQARTQWVKFSQNPQSRVSKSLITSEIMITIFWNKTGSRYTR